jgi:hypothetical protein
LNAAKLAFAFVLLAPLSLEGQGRTDYLNFESPPVHPIEVFRLGGHDFIAACNTRDGSVEIFDTDEGAPDRRLARVRVGLEPVTVRFNPANEKLYTANFVGDSISVMALTAPSGAGSLAVELEQTTWVGDEPLDLAFYTLDDGSTIRETVFVTHMALDGFDWRDAETLVVLDEVEMAPALVTVGIDTSQPDGVQFLDLAAKEPRAVRVRGNELYVLPLKGGSNSLDSVSFDLDLYCDDIRDLFASPIHHGGLHTTGMNMNFDATGTLYIVGGEALNEVLLTEPDVMAAPTGFVRSMVYVVNDPCSPAPIVRRRDVNLEQIDMARGDHRSAGLLRRVSPAGTITVPVAKSAALSMLTDVVAFETGGVPKVFFTAFGNDKVGVLEPDPSEPDPDAWPLRRIDVHPRSGYPLAGPRGLALKRANPGNPADPGPRLYVLNHLDGSIAVIDVVREQLLKSAGLTLAGDPRPDYVVAGQRFLYDALQGNGFNSCSSCHVDGRLDRLPWNLGTPGEPDVPIPPILPDGIDVTLFPADKGVMVTQSLQGLLNSEVEPESQFWVTNAPYHWRGDRASLRDFNPAFESLLGGEQLSAADLDLFEQFVNSIAYPPNPQQSRDRRPSGVFGEGEDLDVDGSTHASRGLKIFHVKPTVGAERSCATGCHALPEGSNNRITDIQFGQPIETAAMRGLLQKEAKRDRGGWSDPKDSPFTGIEGLTHRGFIGGPTLEEFNAVGSMNGFVKHFFSDPLCGAPGQYCADMQALNEFVHEMDWGVGPLVGCPATVHLGNVDGAYPGNPASKGCDGACRDLASALDCMEEQAGEVHSGVSVQAWVGGEERGFWYDPTGQAYLEEPAAGGPLSRSDLLDSLTAEADRLVFQAVPLGDERRLAAPSGTAAPPALGAPPSNLALLPMTPSAMYARVPELSAAWAEVDNTAIGSIFLHTARLYQWGLVQDAAAEGGFGLGGAPRHDAPRRFAVSGQGIRHGAELVLAYLDDPKAGPPDPGLPLDQGSFSLIGMPLYPSDESHPANGDPIWRTAVEIGPLFYYGLMLGGPAAPGVSAAYNDQRPFTFPMDDAVLDRSTPGAFDPLSWNFFYVFVVNADGAVGDGGWQRLRIE